MSLADFLALLAGIGIGNYAMRKALKAWDERQWQRDQARAINVLHRDRERAGYRPIKKTSVAVAGEKTRQFEWDWPKFWADVRGPVSQDQIDAEYSALWRRLEADAEKWQRDLPSKRVVKQSVFARTDMQIQALPTTPYRELS